MREPLGRDALVFSLYDAALDARQWGPIAGQLAKLLRAGSAAVQVREQDEARVLSRTANFTDDDEDAYRAYYHRRDILVDLATARGVNQILSNADLLSDKSWNESEIYRDYFSTVGVHQLVGGVIPLTPGAVAVFSVHRDRRGKTFSAEDKIILGRLMPHVRNALAIQQNLRTSSLERQAAGDFLERSQTALLVVDRGGRLLQANAKGERLLERSTVLTVIAGRIVAARTSVQSRLMRLIEAAADTAAGRSEDGGGALAIPVEHQPPLSITVAPLRPQREGVGFEIPAALVSVRDPGERVEIMPTLQDLFGLTRSEALLANGLVNGLSLHQIAAAHRVTFNTARSQLKSVLTKTETGRQTELVALILRSVAGQI